MIKENEIIANVTVEMNGEKKEFVSLSAAVEWVAKQASKKNITIDTLADGAVFEYGGVEWIKLGAAYGGFLCLSKDVLFKRAINDIDGDENKSNWAKAPLRTYLNSIFRADLINKGASPNDLIEFERDLTTDDGMTDYGTCKDYISMLTCDEYRKFRKYIPVCGKWFWTITADSLLYSYTSRYVSSVGSLTYTHSYYGNGGVRPLLTLKSSALVKEAQI